MLATLEDTYALVTSHIQRVRDLTEQAANGTYGSDSLKAIEAEITARLEEVNRIAANCEFNGLKMMNGSITNDIALQVGLDGTTDSQIALDSDLFAKADVKTLFGGTNELDAVAKKCAGLETGTDASSMLATIDGVINTISGRITTLGAAQNRIDSAIESIAVQSENITSSLSTLRDTDIAEESSNYIQAQILQQAAATLLSTANQTPSIALNLL
jgi:flagellin